MSNYIQVTVSAPEVTADMFISRDIKQFAWCIDNLPVRSYNVDPANYWYCMTEYGKMHFWFLNEQHASMFILKWGN